MKKYGGVNNQKSLYEIQEARIVSAPGMFKIIKKKSKTSIVFGWLIYLIISYIITDLFIIIVTDAGNRFRLPLLALFVLPAVPFILTLSFKILSTISNKKHTNHKD